MNSLKDKVAVVTGAASGIGRAVALELAREGCELAICCDRNMAGLERTGEDIRDIGRRVSTYKLDVSDRKAVYDFARRVMRHHGRVDLLVNNAGVGLVAPIEDMDVDDFEWLMRINFWGMVYGTKAFLPELRKHKSHIANISSVWGLWASPGQAAYTCSKFAIRGFTESLVQELAATNVSVSIVYPGAVQTDIARNARFRTGLGPLTDKETSIKILDRLAVTSPEKAARIIVSGIRRKKRRILVGPDAVFLDWTQRLFPAAYQRIIPLLFNLQAKH